MISLCVEVRNLRLFWWWVLEAMKGGATYQACEKFFGLAGLAIRFTSPHLYGRSILWFQLISCITRGYPDFLQHDLRLFFFFSSVLWSGCFDKPLCRGWFDGISKSISLPRKTWPDFIGAIFQFQIARGWFVAISKVYSIQAAAFIKLPAARLFSLKVAAVGFSEDWAWLISQNSGCQWFYLQVIYIYIHSL